MFVYILFTWEWLFRQEVGRLIDIVIAVFIKKSKTDTDSEMHKVGIAIPVHFTIPGFLVWETPSSGLRQLTLCKYGALQLGTIKFV